jgi:hypothetical protein
LGGFFGNFHRCCIELDSPVGQLVVFEFQTAGTEGIGFDDR